MYVRVVRACVYACTHVVLHPEPDVCYRVVGVIRDVKMGLASHLGSYLTPELHKQTKK